MKLTVTPIFVALCLLLASGCASIVSKNRYDVTISSTPSDADIVITDRKGRQIYRGTTPATVPLKSSGGFFTKADYLVGFEKAGYDRRVVPIRFKLDGWYFGNIVFGGLIGLLIVDPATGAMYKLATEYVSETLQPSSSAGAGGESLKVYALSDIPAEWREHLVPMEE
ncbi:hypothetical protein [Lewinella sp. IMCC34183]|uniref:hypothetical protein n=1 Tax=Lewinella sp. IMCC34183 TaxID=2248762 RepID=UPI000E2787A1|nr:hypothetical protein [Lewinella sp. IMCC34183]